MSNLNASDWIHALKQGHYAKILKALKTGQDPQPVDTTHYRQRRVSPLVHLSWKDPDKAEKVLHALLAARCDVNLPDEMGRLPLHTMIWLYQAPPSALETMLDAGANPRLPSFSVDGKSEMCAASMCIVHHQPRALEVLLSRGIDLKRTPRDTPLVLRALWNCSSSKDVEELLVPLLNAGADPYEQDDPPSFPVGRPGRSAMSEAVDKPYPRCPAATQALMRWKVQPQAQMLEEATPSVRATPTRRI